jgi:phenylalanyl-tRNA synthetase beta chain
MHPVDVIEDIAIARGYDTFEVVMPTAFTVARLAPLTLLADRVRQELVGYGFQEIFSNLLMSRDEVCDRLRVTGALVAIENYVSETYAVLRDRLLPSLLRVEGASTKAPYPHRTFEVGEVAVFDETAPHGSRTEEHAAALIAASEVGFSDVHSHLDALMYFLAKPYALERCDMPFAIEGRAARVVVDGREVGYVAEINPAVLNAWAIDVPVAAFEICLNPLVGGEQGTP